MNSTSAKKKVAVYGTLRAMTIGEPIALKDKIQGLVVDMGAYPALVSLETDHYVEVDVIEVDDATLTELDKYEGVDRDLYHQANTTTVGGHDVIVYVFNRIVANWRYNNKSGYPAVNHYEVPSYE